MPQELEFFGPATELFDWQTGAKPAPAECMVEGPAGTGKSFLIAHSWDSYCRTFPGARLIFLRKTRVSLNGSFLDTWEKEALGEEHPIVLGGPRPESRSQYTYPKLDAVRVEGRCPKCEREAHSKGMRYRPIWWRITPELEDAVFPCQKHKEPLIQRTLYDDPAISEVWLGGMDNETRLFSTQYNAAFVNEMTELTLNEWQSLNRALRRPGTPYRILLGDANPDHEFHWANVRGIEERLYRICTLHKDNPTFTQEYLDRMERQSTGVYKERMFYGRWVTAEGMILDEYSSDKHISDGHITYEPSKADPGDDEGWKAIRKTWLHVEGIEKPVRIHKLFGGQDIGWEDPGVLGLWGIDTEQRVWKLVEAYFCHKTHDWWADRWCELWEEYGRIQAIFCDHDNAFIENLNRRLRQLHPTASWDEKGRSIPSIARIADKTPGSGHQRLMAGLNEIKEAMRERPDGTYGFNLLRDRFRWGKDPYREEKRMPTCLEEEIPAYVFEKDPKTDELQDRPDKRCQEHAIDETRYAFRGMRSFSLGYTAEEEPAYPQGSYGATLFKSRGGWDAVLTGRNKRREGLRRLLQGR